MPIFTTPIHEANDCHLPAGRPDGGQFCSKGGATVTRLDHPPLWRSPAIVQDAVTRGATASRADIAAGRVPLVTLGDSTKVGSMVVAQYQPDGSVHVFPGFFDDDALGRTSLLYHEFGHEVAMRAFSGGKASDQTVEVLRSFRLRPTDPWRYDNFAGFSERPEEMVADIYAQAMTSKTQPWETGGRYDTAMQHVLQIAAKAGLPLPEWWDQR